MQSRLFLVLVGRVAARPGGGGDGAVEPVRPRRRPGSRRAAWILIGLGVGWVGSVEGQGLSVDGGSRPAAIFRSAETMGGPNGLGEVIHAEVTHSEPTDTTAVVGISRPQSGYGFGIGGFFWGGRTGAQGLAQEFGPGFRVGLQGDAWNGEANFGVLGNALAPSAKTAYGVYGSAACHLGTACFKFAVYASGDLVYTGTLYKPSDLRFKESLAPLDEALGKLLALEVVSYEHVRSEEAAPMNLPEGPQVGFIAQQVAEVLPELVGEVVHPGGDPLEKSQQVEPVRYQAVKPIDLIPYLVRALQEQQAQIQELRAQLGPLQHRLAQGGAGAVPPVGAE